jgi:hypothetical protein
LSHNALFSAAEGDGDHSESEDDEQFAGHAGDPFFAGHLGRDAAYRAAEYAEHAVQQSQWVANAQHLCSALEINQ